MQGHSLVPVLKGETPADWRKSFYYHYTHASPRLESASAFPCTKES